MRRDIIAMALGLSAPIFLSSAALAAPTTADFVQTVAVSDMFEIESGQLATEKAGNTDVKSFGQHMVADHSKTSKQLKALVTDEEIKAELPTKLDADHQAKLDKLKDMSGKRFDKSYIQAQVGAHEKAVALFEAYAATGENDDLKKWAGDTLPTLKNHLKEAKALSATVDQVAEADDADKADDRAMRDDNAMAMNDADTKAAETKPVKKSNIKYLNRQAPTDWTAEALIGRTVENSNGDNLGEINNVIINEKGDVVAVVIGVGGFLGIGEKNVGVPFDELDFKTAAAMRDQPDNTTEREAKADEAAARFDTEHADMRIVLNTTKEDLEAAPSFAWLDDQDSHKRERVVQ
jgi:putative membrane protein